MFQVYPYSLRLKAPLVLAGGNPLKERKGILLHNPEINGWGDAAPLPGFSVESFEDLQSAVKEGRWDDPSLPSLRFAVDCAKRRFSFSPGSVSVNALWMPGREKIESLVSRISDWNHPVVKIKVGSVSDEQPILELLQKRPEVKVRLDGNRQLSVEQTLHLYSALPKAQIDYFEEPLRDHRDYLRLCNQEDVPIALDEALLTPQGIELSDQKFVKAYILKPTLLGGADDQNVWLNRAERNKVKITWSSCFESGVGLWHLVQLARGYGAAGLDTDRFFDSHLVHPPPRAVKGAISIEGTKLKVNV